MAEPMSDREAEAHHVEVRSNQDILLEVIYKNPRESMRSWATYCGWTKTAPGPDGKLAPQTGKVSRIIKQLEHKGLYRDGHLTQVGKALAKRIVDGDFT